MKLIRSSLLLDDQHLTLRSALALLALVVGVVTLLVVLTIAQLTNTATAPRLATLGANQITVQGFVIPANSAPPAGAQAVAIRLTGPPSRAAQDVQLQFLIEAATLAISGGCIGAILGVALELSLPRLLTPFARLHVTPSPLPIIAVLAAALLIGPISGLLPAHRAARLNPVEALR